MLSKAWARVVSWMRHEVTFADLFIIGVCNSLFDAITK